MSQQWQVGSSAPEVYQRELVPGVFGVWASPVVDLVMPQLGEQALDVACGTGLVARLLAQRVGTAGHVIGVNLNPAMIAVARSVAASNGSAPIEWREGSAMALPVPDASFNVVCCQLGLQFFADRPAALREMYRVLLLGGRLAIMVWRAIQYCPGFEAFADALEQHVSPESAGVMRAPFALNDADELRSLLQQAGFRDVVVRAATEMVRFPSVEGLARSYIAGSPLAGHLAKAPENAFGLLVGDLTAKLQPYVSVDGLVFPIEAHLASAQK